MSKANEYRLRARQFFRQKWTVRQARSIPSPENVGLTNRGAKVRVAVLYADMVGSSRLVTELPLEFAASVLKSYLHLAAKVIRDSHGKIVSYDGDRIMAVYQGRAIERRAVRTALQLNYLVEEIIQPEINQAYPHEPFTLAHCVGIDVGEVMAVQAGIRGSNDLVWVGNVANIAAKLADIRANPSILMTPDVYRGISEDQRFFDNGTPIWHTYPVQTDRASYVYGTRAWEAIP